MECVNATERVKVQIVSNNPASANEASSGLFYIKIQKLWLPLRWLTELLLSLASDVYSSWCECTKPQHPHKQLGQATTPKQQNTTANKNICIVKININGISSPKLSQYRRQNSQQHPTHQTVQHSFALAEFDSYDEYYSPTIQFICLFV